MTTNKPRQQSAALERLHSGVAELLTSTSWIQALTFRSSFYQYSFLNCLLILNQLPAASLVCGYRKWQELNRQVRKGEKGITILAPLIRKDDNNPDKRILFGFKEVKVFDVSQTDGDPLPQAPKPTLLSGSNQLIERAITALEDYCKESSINFDRALEHPTALGVFRVDSNSISLRAGLPKLQELKTLVHELAHALLHADASINRITAELEAESAAFLTLHQLGLDTSSYSFAYLANWSHNNLDSLIAAGDNASKAADTLLITINNHLNTSETASPPPVPTVTSSAIISASA